MNRRLVAATVAGILAAVAAEGAPDPPAANAAAGGPTNAASAGAAATNAPAAGGAAPAVTNFNALRDPFWPIGWRPPTFDRDRSGDEDRSGLIRWDEATRLLRVNGLSRKTGGGYVAFLTDIGVIEAGQTVSVQYRGLTYRWRIKRITAEGIVPQRIGVFRE